MKRTIGTLVLLGLLSLQVVAARDVPALEIRAPNGRTSLLVPHSDIPSDEVRQPSAQIMRGARVYVRANRAYDEDFLQSGEDGLNDQTLAQGLQPLLGLSVARTDASPWSVQLDRQSLTELARRFQCKEAADQRQDVKVDPLLMAATVALSPHIAMSYASVPCAQVDVKTREEVLSESARQAGTPSVVLESVLEALQDASAVPERVVVHQVKVMLSPAYPAMVKEMVRILNSGDYEALTPWLRAFFPDDQDRRTALVVETAGRRERWLPRLHEHLHRGGAVISLDVMQLPGPTGLISQLTEAGYRVRPVMIPAGQPARSASPPDAARPGRPGP